MKLFKYLGAVLATFAISLSYSFLAFADETVPVDSFLTQVLNFVKSAGGMPWTLKVAGVVLLVVASMKVSFMKPIWDKLGAAKAWLAPLLGFVGGFLSLAVDGTVTLPALVAYSFAGAGAVVLHELLDSIKAMPGLGAMWISVIGVIQGLLGGKKSA
jgi:hypothetical protein